jgi:hypothetical protein
MTNEQKLIRECLDWLVEFHSSSKLNDIAEELLGDLIERCHDVVGPNRDPLDPEVVERYREIMYKNLSAGL